MDEHILTVQQVDVSNTHYTIVHLDSTSRVQLDICFF